MSAESTSISSVPRKSSAASAMGLRRLRRLCLATAVVCAATLPFQLGAVRAPALSTLPIIGRFFPQPRPEITRPAIIGVYNFPRTAVEGHTERFAVRLADMPHATLTYVLRYPDGRTETAVVRTDARGYSWHTFRLTAYWPHHYRETATIEVHDATGNLYAFTRFAIQQKHDTRRHKP